jgi:predicted Fe-Mo cluster-binding NifX family protein
MITVSGSVVVCVLAFAWSGAFAQRGTGDPQGVARQPAKPQVVSLAGEVLEVKTEPCQMTTGRSSRGAHLLIKTSEGKTINLHLGPAAAVESVTEGLSRGAQIKAEAFQTETMEKDQYIARSLTIGRRTVELRDENLRPRWAGSGLLRERPAKIAVTAKEPSLDASLDPRFGRCRYFLLVDSHGETFEAVKNPHATHGSAGVRSARMIAEKGAQVVLTGKCGPSASRSLSAAGIQIVPGCSGTVRAAIRQFKAGQLQPVTDADLEE